MLAAVTAAAGYDVVQATESWVPKEITVVARKPAAPRHTAPVAPPRLESEQVFRGWQTLEQILNQVETFRASGPLGIFGTSIAATWLDAQTANAAAFFVDEDTSRVGKQHQGRPILSPAGVPAGATVYVALPPMVGGDVAARLRGARPDVRFVTP